MRIFREIKLCAFARNVPIFDGLVFARIFAVGVEGVKVFCSDGGLVNLGKIG